MKTLYHEMHQIQSQCALALIQHAKFKVQSSLYLNMQLTIVVFTDLALWVHISAENSTYTRWLHRNIWFYNTNFGNVASFESWWCSCVHY